MNKTYLYKYNPNNLKMIETNLLYSPELYPNKLKMVFDNKHEYQTTLLNDKYPLRPDYTVEMVENLFKIEQEYLLKFSEYDWCPTLLDIGHNYVTIQFPGLTLNHIIYSGQNLDEYLPDWKIQLENIIMDIYNLGYYKLTLYPHCFYVEDNILKTFDFYAILPKANPYIEPSTINGLISNYSKDRFNQALVNGKYDGSLIFKQALKEYVYWPDNYLNKIYNKIYS